MKQVFTNISELFTLAPAALKGGRKMTDGDLGPVKNAAFVTDGDKIIWLGERKKLPKEFAKIKREHSLRGDCVLPGFVESHTHLIFAGSRSAEFDLRNRGVSYQEISKRGGGILSTLRETEKASSTLLLGRAQASADEFIRQGVTTLEVKSGYTLNFKGEKKLLEVASRIENVRTIKTYLGAHALPKEFNSTKEYIKNLVENDLPRLKKLADRVDIFIEKGFFSIEDGRIYLAAAKKLGFEACVHADQLSLSGGAELALEFGALSADHLIQIGEIEIRKLAASEVTCTLLPGSDLYMKCAYPPARQLIDAGARVALATDFNPGTCPTQDLSLIGVLARIEMKMSLAEVIAAYTIGGAYALGLQKRIGSLEIGKQADFTVLHDGVDSLFYQVGKSPVRETWNGAKKVFAFN